MLKNLLAKVGIGSAKVDTVLENMTLTQGDIAQGTVRIQGGNVDQDINRVTISVMTTAKDDDIHMDVAIGSIHINSPMKLAAGQQLEIPFSFKLPSETPITSIAAGKNTSKVWVATELDIESGLDSTDRDYLTVLPHPAVEMMVNKFLQNNFVFKKVDVEKGYLNGSTFSSTSGIYQEIEMRPASRGFSWNSRTVNEVELSFIVEESMVHLLVEVDRSFAGDGYVSVSYPTTVQAHEIDVYFAQVFPS